MTHYDVVRTEFMLKSKFRERRFVLKKPLGEYTLDELRGKLIVFINRSTEIFNEQQRYIKQTNHTETPIDDDNKMLRVYPFNIQLSSNFDHNPYIKNYNFISMNSLYNDVFLRKFLSFFRNGNGKIVGIRSRTPISEGFEARYTPS
jgi:hypothetical protein